MPQDDASLLEIVQACEKALKYVEAIDQASFISNEMLHDAVMLQLVVIGEAAKNLSKDFRLDRGNRWAPRDSQLAQAASAFGGFGVR